MHRCSASVCYVQSCRRACILPGHVLYKGCVLVFEGSWKGALVLSQSMTVRGTSATALSSQLVKDLPTARPLIAPNEMNCSCKARGQLATRQLGCACHRGECASEVIEGQVHTGGHLTVLANSRKGNASRKPMRKTAIAAAMTGVAYLHDMSMSMCIGHRFAGED